MSKEAQIQHLRNAIADVIQTVPFELAMMLFEGAKTPPEEGCQRFLRRLCEATRRACIASCPWCTRRRRRVSPTCTTVNTWARRCTRGYLCYGS